MTHGIKNYRVPISNVLQIYKNVPDGLAFLFHKYTTSALK